MGTELDRHADLWQQVETAIPCDAGEDRPAAWLVTWAVPVLPCGACKPNRLLCQEHFAVIANALRNGTDMVCKHSVNCGPMAALIIKAEPL